MTPSEIIEALRVKGYTLTRVGKETDHNPMFISRICYGEIFKKEHVRVAAYIGKIIGMLIDDVWPDVDFKVYSQKRRRSISK